NYEGTFLVVSHDREFLDGLTNRIWDIENQTLKIHHYHVKEYLAMKMADPNSQAKSMKEPEKKAVVVEKKEVRSALSQEDQKELKRKKSQLQNQDKKSEELIASLEKKIKELDEVLVTLDYTDEVKSTPVLENYSKSKAELDQAMEDWELNLEKLTEFE